MKYHIKKNLSKDKLEEILDPTLKYASIISVLVDDGVTSMGMSLIYCDVSQLVSIEAHTIKIQLLLIEVFTVLEVGFLLYPSL